LAFSSVSFLTRSHQPKLTSPALRPTRATLFPRRLTYRASKSVLSDAPRTSDRGLSAAAEPVGRSPPRQRERQRRCRPRERERREQRLPLV